MNARPFDEHEEHRQMDTAARVARLLNNIYPDGIPDDVTWDLVSEDGEWDRTLTLSERERWLIASYVDAYPAAVAA